MVSARQVHTLAGVKQLQHCRIDFKSDLEALQLLKFQNLVSKNSVIAGHLRHHLSNDWHASLRSFAADHTRQPLSSLDRGLGRLASLA